MAGGGQSGQDGETAIPTTDQEGLPYPSKRATVTRMGALRWFRSKGAEFYLSIVAIVLSTFSLALSYLTSPLSRATRPRLRYGYIWLGDLTKGSSGCTMAGIIRNESDFAAEQVIVTVSSGGMAASSFTPSRDLEYSVLQSTEELRVYKIPVLPPHYQWQILVSLAESGENCAQLYKWPRSPSIESVTARNAVAQKIPDVVDFASSWSAP